AYELGVAYENRVGDEPRALDAYRRAFELDPSLRPNMWALRAALYRRGHWAELVKVIDVELGRAATDPERTELLLERAAACGHRGLTDDQARTALDAALRLAPRHLGVLLELERVAARADDLPALLDVRERLAHTA